MIIIKLFFLFIVVTVIIAIAVGLYLIFSQFMLSLTHEAELSRNKVRAAKMMRDELDRQIEENMKSMDVFSKRKLLKSLGEEKYNSLRRMQ